MNKNIWELYKTSEKGKKAIALFSFNKGNINLEFKAKEIFKNYSEFLGGDDKETEDCFVYDCFSVINSIFACQIFIEKGERSEHFYNKLIDNLEICFVEENSKGDLIKVENETPIIAKKDYKNLCSILSEISFILYLYGDGFFIPILFKEQFDILMRIFDVLNIPMPELPAKSNKRERLLLYYKLNYNILEFAKCYNLTPEETCACIYDFAPMLIESEPNSEMPEPTNVWLTGASKEDYITFLKEPLAGAKSVWTCNENTKKGDIIIMYVRAPYSCIQSIWRADIDGVFTPFNYYNSRTKATDGIVVPNITLAELKEDSYFSKLPITRKNFQGVNGVYFSANDYIELQRLFRNKGFDTSILPQLYNPNFVIEGQINNEKDVEEKLLIPILKNLGYSDLDWSRQLTQKAGRTEKAIPDFVFFPKGELHFQNAPLVIEAKFDMSSNIEKTKAFNQALSYARLMKSTLFGICDKDRFLIYKEKNGSFDRFNPTFEKHWYNLRDSETFRILKLLIGKESIQKIKQ